MKSPSSFLKVPPFSTIDLNSSRCCSVVSVLSCLVVPLLPPPPSLQQLVLPSSHPLRCHSGVWSEVSLVPKSGADRHRLLLVLLLLLLVPRFFGAITKRKKGKEQLTEREAVNSIHGSLSRLSEYLRRKK